MNWKSMVSSIAPVLGTALGGPFGGMAAKWLSAELLGDEDAREAELEAIISNANPDTLLKIKELEQSFKLEMKRIGLKESQLEVQDRQDARKLFTINIWPQITLSTIFIVGYFFILGFMFFTENIIPVQQQSILNILLGVLTAGVTMIMQFWFGSSMGSKEKTEKL